MQDLVWMHVLGKHCLHDSYPKATGFEVVPSGGAPAITIDH